MIQEQLLRVIQWAWTAFGAYWIIAARRQSTERTPEQIKEKSSHRVVRLVLLVIVFIVLFSEQAGIGLLGRRFLPQRPTIAYIGFLLALTGMGIAVWAGIHLGQYWSDKAVLQTGHQLILTGPYAYMRHPIYSGVLLSVGGIALVVNEWRAVLAFSILLVNYSVKAKREERILAGAFVDAFAEHKRRAGFLLPRFRARS